MKPLRDNESDVKLSTSIAMNTVPLTGDADAPICSDSRPPNPDSRLTDTNATTVSTACDVNVISLRDNRRTNNTAPARIPELSRTFMATGSGEPVDDAGGGAAIFFSILAS